VKRDFPELKIVLNGGITGLQEIAVHLLHVDGVMLGRKAYTDPYLLTRIQARYLNGPHHRDWFPPSRERVVRGMVEYARRELRKGVRLHHITRHMLGLFNGVPGAGKWRRFISERSTVAGAGPEVLLDSLACLSAAA
jgi:tRNA-dihydrouridine synthase A